MKFERPTMTIARFDEINCTMVSNAAAAADGKADELTKSSAPEGAKAAKLRIVL